MRLASALRLLLSVFALSAVLASGALAAERHALVVGNADYDSATLTPLKNPANDAALIADSLKSAGFDVTLVLNADLRGMKRAVRAFTDKLSAAGDGSLAAVYYSGHGFEAGGRNYLAPLKADLRDEVDAEFEALSVDWLLSTVEAAHGGANIVILDACRNTALTRSVGGTAGGFTLLQSTPRGSFISFATAPGSTATDGSGLNSPYTAAIAEEILVPGSSVEAVFKKVRQRVVAATDGEQVPWDHSSLTADIVLLPAGEPRTAEAGNADASGNSGKVSAVRLELQLWNDVKDSGSAEQLQAYLDRYPQGAFAALARDRLAKARTGTGGEVERLFAQLASRSLIVDTPTQPHEFYANARLRELKGDYPKARQDYLKYFAFGMPQVDPHLRFQAVLKIQEGRAGAREVYRALSQGRRDPTTLFAEILLQDREERVRRLTAFTEAEPEFTPALYALSLDYSQARLGQQSLADKTREAELLTRFMKGVEDGRFLGYYIDQQMAAEQLEDARTRLAALSVMNSAIARNPVTLNAMRSNQGWMLTLAIADRAREIFIRLPDGEFRSTGFVSGALDPTTGQPVPYPAFELPGTASKTSIEVKYLDIRGETQGPFTLSFNPASALVAGQKDILERMSSAWLSYRDWDGKLLVYFTHLISYRCAISEVRYGIDSDTPDKTFPVGACDPDNPHAIPDKGPGSEVQTNVPKATRYISVQLTYADGTRSEVKRFDVPR
ncbi:caspase family protein [Stappia indica]|uniref:caspase family protein n=1 Tax=Stappia indica TaxID=538381 RepID=UPI001CD6FE89|nr:caspase family protein [Stappia indica]MCA1298129.1 caspase family protein [Stappia indica]